MWTSEVGKISARKHYKESTRPSFYIGGPGSNFLLTQSVPAMLLQPLRSGLWILPAGEHRGGMIGVAEWAFSVSPDCMGAWENFEGPLSEKLRLLHLTRNWF